MLVITLIESVPITDLTPGIGYGITAPASYIHQIPNFMGGSYVQQSIINLGNDIEGAFLSVDGGKLYTASLTGTPIKSRHSMSVMHMKQLQSLQLMISM